MQVGKTGNHHACRGTRTDELAGNVVSRASLHNAEEIARKDIRVGDVIIVEKAGKIIPHVSEWKASSRNRTARVFFSVVCPECSRELVKDPNGVYIRCPNPACPAN